VRSRHQRKSAGHFTKRETPIEGETNALPSVPRIGCGCPFSPALWAQAAFALEPYSLSGAQLPNVPAPTAYGQAALRNRSEQGGET